MKASRIFFALCVSSLPAALHAELIAQWNFNDTPAPCYGLGTAALVGGTTATAGAVKDK